MQTNQALKPARPAAKVLQIRGMQNLRMIRNIALGIGSLSGGLLVAEATSVVKTPAIVPTAMLMVGAFLTAAAVQTLISANQYIEKQLSQPL